MHGKASHSNDKNYKNQTIKYFFIRKTIAHNKSFV